MAPTDGGIAVIGEAIADVFVQTTAPPGTLDLRAYPGGGPANTAVALGRLGAPTAFLGRFATGPLGTMLYDHLAAAGVDLSASVRADGPASLAIAAVDEQGLATYEFHLTGGTDWHWRADELARLPNGIACVHTGSLALAIEPGGPLIEQLLATYRPHGTVCVDPNVRPGIVDPADYRAHIARWCRLADILRLSDEDLPVLAPGLTFGQACRQWHDAGVQLVVLTWGANGAVASLNGVEVTVPAARLSTVDIVDTVGAGDSFTAGLLYALHEKDHLSTRLARLTIGDVANALDFAATVAAFTCSARGADPPWRSQLDAVPARGGRHATDRPR